MLAAGGGGLLSAESVRLMTLDRVTAQDRAENQVFVGDYSGWGLMMLTPAAGGPAGGVPGGFGWDGGTGTTWRTDPVAGLTGILLTQRMVTSPEAGELVTDFWTSAYTAIRP
jgi:CubicO group peptidase (beta-lactamase class C family)